MSFSYAQCEMIWREWIKQICILFLTILLSQHLCILICVVFVDDLLVRILFVILGTLGMISFHLNWIIILRILSEK